MGDTTYGNFTDKFCSDCGKRGCYIHYRGGQLIPKNSFEGYFDDCLFIRNCTFHLMNGIPMPLLYNSSTGEKLDPKISFSKLGKKKYQKSLVNSELTLEYAPNRCNYASRGCVDLDPKNHKDGCVSRFVTVSIIVSGQKCFMTMSLSDVNFK